MGVVECCAQCPRPATDVVVRLGCEVHVCPSCWVWASMDAPAAPAAPEAIPVLPDEANDDEPEDEYDGVYGWCWDCELYAAEKVFHHLDDREIPLCMNCWYDANHEPDYLLFCECVIPRHDADGWSCAECHYEIRDRIEEPDSDSDSDAGSDADDVDEESWSYPSVDI